MHLAIQRQLPVETAPLPEPVPWDVSGPGLGPVGTAPSWPLCFRTAVTAGSRGRSRALLARLLGEDNSILCEFSSQRGWGALWALRAREWPALSRQRGLLLGAHSWQDEPRWCLLAACSVRAFPRLHQTPCSPLGPVTAGSAAWTHKHSGLPGRRKREKGSSLHG